MITKLLRYFALITAAAQFAAAATPEEEIRAVLARQTADWNRGSTDAFVEGYSAETVFVTESTRSKAGAGRLVQFVHDPLLNESRKLTV